MPTNADELSVMKKNVLCSGREQKVSGVDALPIFASVMHNPAFSRPDVNSIGHHMRPSNLPGVLEHSIAANIERGQPRPALVNWPTLALRQEPLDCRDCDF